MSNLASAIRNIVSISEFNRGLAGKVFSDVKKGGTKVVIKNNAAECILMSPDEYIALMDELNDARLFRLATERMSQFDEKDLVSQEDLLKDLGISDQEIDDFEGVELA